MPPRSLKLPEIPFEELERHKAEILQNEKRRRKERWESRVPSKLSPILHKAINNHFWGDRMTRIQGVHLLAVREKHPELLKVPETYTHAYRILSKISPEIAHTWGVPAGARAPGLIATPGVYKPVLRTVCCWTVSRETIEDATYVFRDELRIYAAGANTPLQYGLVVAVDLAVHRSKFLFNPDTLYEDVAEGDPWSHCHGYTYQKEVISLGTVPVLGVAYFRINQEHDAYEADYRTALALLP